MMKVYFDLETLSLNPYSTDAKIILAQVKYGIESKLLKEWEIGEENLIVELIGIFSRFPKYTPVFTYNGGFDFSYLMGRINQMDLSREFKEEIHDVFIRNIKHCDLLQFDNGYFVPFWKICKLYNMPLTSEFDGKMMGKLYEDKNWDKILEHGLEDIEALDRVVSNTNIADRYLKTEILTWKQRKERR